jgi:acetoin utilization deacetylase AcuC-like enzyme
VYNRTAMKLVFHEDFLQSDYATDPAASPGRLDGIMRTVRGDLGFYQIVRPEPAGESDLFRAHDGAHVLQIKRNRVLYEMAALAAGGAIKAALLAWGGHPAFAVIRPPGHHASAAYCWGFCFFNNVSVSLLRLFSEKKIQSAFVLDFDLHTGDGNIDILQGRRDGFRVSILNPRSNERRRYLSEVESHLQKLSEADIFVASAGFDQGIDDWGKLLLPQDYRRLGELMAEHSERVCRGRRYALLEGGYNHDVLGDNLDAFCRGFAGGSERP